MTNEYRRGLSDAMEIVRQARAEAQQGAEAGEAGHIIYDMAVHKLRSVELALSITKQLSLIDIPAGARGDDAEVLTPLTV